MTQMTLKEVYDAGGIVDPTMIETAQEMRGNLKPGNRKAYVLAGRATVTLLNPKTGNRFTFRVVRRDKDETFNFTRWFVEVLSGPENSSDYSYVGMYTDRGFKLTKASRMTMSAPSFLVFDWFTRNFENASIEAWHEGARGRCGHKLTVPESIETGLGPVCAGR